VIGVFPKKCIMKYDHCFKSKPNYREKIIGAKNNITSIEKGLYWQNNLFPSKVEKML